jgi:hypothetical protein
VHIYHHLFANNTIYRLDETDQITYTFESEYSLEAPFVEIGCIENGIQAFYFNQQSPLYQKRFGDDGDRGITFENQISVFAMKSVYLANERVFFVFSTPISAEDNIQSQYFDVSLSAVTNKNSPSSSQTPIAAHVMEQLTELNVYLEGSTITASALGAQPYSFSETFSGSALTSIEVFWSPPSYYIALFVDGEFAIYYKKELDPAPEVYDFIGTAVAKNMQFRSELFPEWNGALFSLQSNRSGFYLHGFVNGSQVFSENVLAPPLSSLLDKPILSLDQLDEASFIMTFWDGVSLTSQVARFSEIPPVTLTPVTPPETPPQGDNTQVISFNSTTTVTTLALTNNTVLVVTNEAVIEVTDCAELAGKLKYILTQSQYNALLEKETIDIIVLLTQCTNGSFDAIEVIFEGVDAECLEFTGTPNLSPSQLTLLVTKSTGGCNLSTSEPGLSTGAIIGIVVGCAAAVVLIIVLALYFSPLSAKVFPYAPKNK